jgi:DinB superfamily
MDPLWREILWYQFGAAIETLENAITACPDELWRARLWRELDVQPEFVQFWYIAYHTIFWLDYYCSDSAEGFSVPPPFTTSEMEMGAAPPERAYTKTELLSYLEAARAKCRAKIESQADVSELQRVRSNWRVKTVAELLLYTMRHVQEHAAQMNMLLGQQTDAAPGWVGQVKLP